MTEAVAKHMHRVAVYFAPDVGTAWWDAGSRWLGRSAAGDGSVAQQPVDGVPVDEQRRLTQAPRRYGWHATLKAPFMLADGVDLPSLRAALRRIADRHAPFDMPLQVARLDDFLALVPDGDTTAIDALAAACVTGLHAFARPLSASDLERRRAAGLTPEEDAMLVRWGYPFVLDTFRFHMSLTGALQGASTSTVDALHAAASATFGALPHCRFASLSLFGEPRAGADFVLIEQMRLG